MTTDALAGREKPTVPGKEAAELYPRIRDEVRELVRKGIIVEMVEE